MKHNGFTKSPGQVLLFVLLLLVLGMVLVHGLASMWESMLTVISLERDSMSAFYLAQAGIERAKIAVFYNNTTATYSCPNPANATEDPNGDGFYEDLNISTSSNYHYQYNFTVVDPGGAVRALTGRGRVLDAYNKIVAFRQISLNVTNIADVAPANGVDDDLSGTVVADTWRE